MTKNEVWSLAAATVSVLSLVAIPGESLLIKVIPVGFAAWAAYLGRNTRQPEEIGGGSVVKTPLLKPILVVADPSDSSVAGEMIGCLSSEGFDFVPLDTTSTIEPTSKLTPPQNRLDLLSNEQYGAVIYLISKASKTPARMAEVKAALSNTQTPDDAPSALICVALDDSSVPHEFLNTLVIDGSKFEDTLSKKESCIALKNQLNHIYGFTPKPHLVHS